MDLPRTDADGAPFLGAWDLVSFTRTLPDGSVEHPYGADARGSIVYSPDGVVSYQLCSGSRPRWTSGDFCSGTSEERAAAAASWRSYVARWSICDGVVTHDVFISFQPDRVGARLRRAFAFCEGPRGEARLSLVPVDDRSGGAREELVWTRASGGGAGAAAAPAPDER